MHLRSLPTMERISVPVRRHPEHYFVVQRSVRLIAIILYQGYNTLKQGLFHIKAVTALLRESHTLNKAVTAVFTSKAAARYKAVIVLRHTTALLRDPYCNAVSTRTRIVFPHHKYVADQQPTDRQFRYSNRPIRCSTQLNRYYGHYYEHHARRQHGQATRWSRMLNTIERACC